MAKRPRVDTDKWKVGQEVTMVSTGRILGHYRIKRITKTQIIVENDEGKEIKFDADGYHRLNNSGRYQLSNYQIYPTTQEHRETIQRAEMLYEINHYDYYDLSFEEVKQIYDLMMELKNKEQTDE